MATAAADESRLSSLDDIRGKAASLLQALEDDSVVPRATNENSALPRLPPCWVHPEQTEEYYSRINDDTSRKLQEDEYYLSPEQCQFFQATGFLHVKQFVTAEIVSHMKTCMERMVQEEWKFDEGIDDFGTTESQNTARGDYFLESADTVYFFAEPAAITTEEPSRPPDAREGKISPPRKRLLDEYRKDPMKALNKAGHGMHCRPDTPFYKYCWSESLGQLVRDLGWQEPVVPQSMYIFKQGKTGGAVTSHQDSTFLCTEPTQSCLGLWLALDDATLTNGCLWVRPTSHLEPLRRQYKRNVAHFGIESIESRSNATHGDVVTQPKFIMEQLHSSSEVPWEGALPGGKKEESGESDSDENDDWQALFAAGFIPVECKAGDLLAFCGTLDHLSLPNTSDAARHTFQLHLIEGPGAGITWSKYNWLQYPAGKEFVCMKNK